MKKLIIVLLLAWVLGGGIPAMAALVDLNCEPDTKTVNIGETFSLDFSGLSDPDGQAIKGISLNLQWDPSVLEFDSYVDKVDNITGGGFLWWDAILLNQASGTATIDGAVMMGSVQADLLLYSVSFNAIAAGSTEITTSGSIVRDLNNATITGNLDSADITVIPEPATLCLLGLGALGLLRKRRA
jgi:hypothetical protein